MSELIKIVISKKPFSMLHIHHGVPIETKVKCFLCDAGMKTKTCTGDKMIIGETVPIRIIDTRADFDKACAEAYYTAINVFGITVDGCSDKLAKFVRSTDNIHVKFLSYEHIGSMIGHEHLYKFEAWIEREEDE